LRDTRLIIGLAVVYIDMLGIGRGCSILWTGLFGYFVSTAAPVTIPGAAFFVSATVFLAASILAIVWGIGASGGGGAGTTVSAVTRVTC
jgi:hypothetical protein